MASRDDGDRRESGGSAGPSTQSQTSLLDSASELRALVEAVPDAIVTADRRGQITTFNRSAEQTFGYEGAEIIGRPLLELFPARHHADLERFFRKGTRKGTGSLDGQTVELEARHKSGEHFPIDISMASWETRDHGLAFAGIVRDISEHKKAVCNLTLAHKHLVEAKEQAEEAAMAKSRFLANMSHEIRTPMNGILGMTDLLTHTDLRPRQREYLTLVEESAYALLRVLNDILDFSRIEIGGFSLQPRPFDLDELVGTTLQTLAASATSKGLELAYKLDPEVPMAVIADRGRLRQILVNLVQNAVKFTPRGEVVVTVRAATLTHDEAVLQFSVSDTGVGIPNDKLEVIFEPFDQVDTSLTREHQGAGLGLTIASQLVSMMGGDIWVESEVGAGSTFHFTVSVERVERQHRQLTRNVSSLLDVPVLVVDDNATNRRILQEQLESWKMRARAVDSGLAALDVMMPGMNGYEVAEALQRDERFGEPALLMLSSAGRLVDATRARRLGIVRHLTKPAKELELVAAISEALGLVFPYARIPRRRDDVVAPRIAPLRILLAEDSPVNRKLAMVLLEKAGHSVTTAENGQQVLRLLDSPDAEFDMILMDVQMPVMDGFEATHLVRQREEQSGDHLPIIALTAHAMKGDRERCLAAGMDAYVAKPLDREELFRTIALNARARPRDEAT